MKEEYGLQPITGDSVESQVLSALTDAIFAGKLHPGQLLREGQLARDLHVSQSSVRHALIRLENRGLADKLPDIGTFVTRLSRSELYERLEVRKPLEILACVEGAKQMTEENFRELEREAERMVRDEASTSDLKFHKGIWKRAGNETLFQTLDQVTAPLFAFASITRGLLQNRKTRRDSHLSILSALRSQDRSLIAETVTTHIDTAYQQFFEGRYSDFRDLLENMKRLDHAPADLGSEISGTRSPEIRSRSAVAGKTSSI
jgi:DNA-binding GntR family transcriptional regulator